MAIIYSYPEIPDVQGGDLLLISDTGAPNKPTRSVDIDDLAAYIGTVVGVVQNLQSVLTVGNTYVSPDGYGTFTLNDIANNDGSIKFANTDEGWGYQISAEEGFNITDGHETNLMSIYSSGLSIRNGAQIMNIGTNALTATRNVYFPDASGTIALENVSEWYNVTGSRGLGNLLVKIGDYDNSGNGTFLSIDDADQSIIFTKGGVVESKFVFAATQDRDYTFPNADGTIALTSDIPAPGPGGSGTTNYTARWTNASTLGIGALYDNGTNVGIGTTNPTQKLEVNGTVLLSTLPNNNGRLCLGDVSTNLFSNAASGHLYISTNNSSRMTILNNGNVGIGTTSPGFKLDVAGNAKVSSNFYIGNVDAVTTATEVLVRQSDRVRGITPANLINASGGPFLPLAGGAMTGNTNHSDNVKDRYGTGNDFQIWHDGSNTFLSNEGEGHLNIINTGDDRDIIFKTDDGSGATTSYMVIDGSAEQTRFYKDTRYTDGIKANFGDSNDLQIYHSGSHSYIKDTGTGSLYLQTNGSAIYLQDTDGNAMAQFTDGGGSFLFYNGNLKLSTTNTGVTVTGAATATTFLGDLNGTINTATTAVTKANATNDTTVATTAFVQNLIGTIPAGLVFQGTWNAATNTPTLTSGSGTTGHFYIVSTDGSTNLDGITDWKVGDWAVFVEQGASDQWEKVDNSSVLDGSGTGGSIAGWAGSGTSNTLTNAPITFSGNNTTFAGNITTNTGLLDLNIGTTNIGIEVKSTDAGSYIRFDDGDNADRWYLGVQSGDFGIYNNANEKPFQIDSSKNATFTGNISFGDSHFIGDDANDNLLIQGSASENVIIRSEDGLYFRTGGNNTRLSINSSGNVGIGTTSPTANLHVTGVSSSGNLPIAKIESTGNISYLKFFNSSTGTGSSDGTYIGMNGGTAYLINKEAGNLYLGTGDDINLTLQNGGNVGIGTTSPSRPLSVYRSTAGSAANFLHYTDATAFAGLYIDVDNVNNIVELNASGDTASTMAFQTGNAERMRITTTGNVGIGTTSPGHKLSVIGGHIQTDGNVYTNVIRDNTGGNVSIQDNGGNVGIGTASPAYKLDIYGGNIQINNGGATWLGSDSTGGFARTFNGNTFRFISSSNSETVRIDNATGNVGIGVTSPATVGGTAKLTVNVGSGTSSPVSIVNGTTDGMYIRRYAVNGQYQIQTTSGSGNSGNLSLQSYGGNVGIGTTNPGGNLHVVGRAGQAGQIYLSDIDNGSGTGDALLISKSGNNAFVYNRDSGSLSFGSNNTSNYLNITSSGNVGIGTTSPANKLDVVGISRFTHSSSTSYRGAIETVTDNAYPTWEIGWVHTRTTSSTYGTIARFNNQTGTSIGGIVYSGSSGTSFVTTSDYRLKENIKEIRDSISRVKKLKPCRFNFAAEKNRIIDGFIAHEVQEVVPEAVHGEKDALQKDGSIDAQTLEVSRLIPVLTKALQEAINKIEELELRIQTIENN